MQKEILSIIILVFSLMLLPIHTFATAEFEKREVIFEFLQKAFQAQVSLSEQNRSLNEVKKVLSPYFTNSYTEKFLKENLVEENGQYFTLGTDFALYFIPFFKYSPATKIVQQNNQIYVFEYFQGNSEGPVMYDSHYEGVLLEIDSEGKLKVVDYLFSVPETITKFSEDSKKVRVSENIKPTITFQFLFARPILRYPIELLRVGNVTDSI